MSMNPGYGSGNTKRTVRSSTFSILPGLPLIDSSAVPVGVRSLLPYRSSYQKITSSAPNGAPSDHLWPFRKNSVSVRPPSPVSQRWATDGISFVPLKFQKIILSDELIRLPFSLSPGPVKARRQVPPYVPISASGLTTIGSSGMRCSTGGSLPALTSSASIGASPSLAGRFASARISGPSHLPISCAPSFCSPGLLAAAGAAGLAASAGFAASAGLAGAAAGVAAAGAVVAAGAAGFAGSAGLAGSAGFVAGAAGAQAASRLTPTTPRPARRNDLRDSACSSDINARLLHHGAPGDAPGLGNAVATQPHCALCGEGVPWRPGIVK